jgi:hypothetical protein
MAVRVPATPAPNIRKSRRVRCQPAFRATACLTDGGTSVIGTSSTSKSATTWAVGEAGLAGVAIGSAVGTAAAAERWCLCFLARRLPPAAFRSFAAGRAAGLTSAAAGTVPEGGLAAPAGSAAGGRFGSAFLFSTSSQVRYERIFASASGAFGSVPAARKARRAWAARSGVG